MYVRISIWCILVLAVSVEAMSHALLVKEIEISGHHRTKELTILRELDFTIGDTILLSELTQRLDRNRANLLNTALFTEAELNIKEWDHDALQIVVSISVKEAWYLYIIPIVELADRNFNVWWQEHHRAFNRLNLGVSAYHINLTGIRDRLKVKGQVGYTPKFEIHYQLPYFNREKSLGITTNALWSSNKEVAYITRGNKLEFYKNDKNPAFRRFRLQAGLRYRPNLYMMHDLDLAFYSNCIDPIIAFDNNPDFFLHQKTRQHYFALRYKSVYDNRDLQLFPMKGIVGGIEVHKEGLGSFDDVNSLSITGFVEYHYPVLKNVSVGVMTKGQYGVIRKKQPFWNYQGLGFGNDYIRGYELYVINGMDYVYGKASVITRLINSSINWKRKMPKAFREMPLQFYVTLNYDIGHVNDPFFAAGNPLVNRTLSGGGPGLALVLSHTFALQAEYSFNELGENGLFLHTKTSF
ncbi:MAG TPA: BamA/TamA family outer membrane protein [Saprospiraceae bacterium]|nr:BamA/TamA family outer membrane protein [Saprospiraceae bacterium]